MALKDKIRRQVRAESRLRFGPQKRQLRQESRDLDETYATDVQIARQTARGAKRAARAVKPSITKNVGNALETVTAGPTPGVSAALGNLGPAAARDSEGAKRRLAETLAGATTELDQRVVDAEAGKSSAIMQAQAQRVAGKGRLRDQLRGVAADAGTFRQGRAGELDESARDRRVRKRGQDVTRANSRDSTASQDKRAAAQLEETSRHNRATEKNAAADGGAKKATPARQEAASAALELARTQAKRLKGAGRSRQEVKDLLVQGRSDQTIDDPENPGQKLKVPGVKSVKALWAQVALDLEFDGRLSEGNLRRLRKLGYGANMLGIGKFKPKPPPNRRDGDKAVNKSPGSDRAQG